MSKDCKYSDERLLADFISGRADINAYEHIFQRYYPMVLRFVRGMLKDTVMAEDVAQNIFMKLWINRKTLQKDSSLKNYLCVLARNEVLNILKSKTKTSLTFQPQLQDMDTSSQSSMVEDWFNFVETNARIKNDVESMPPQRQAVFKMSRYEQLSNIDIAIRLNISVRTVEKHLELALKDLRKSIS